jgi:hypothetical protein
MDIMKEKNHVRWLSSIGTAALLALTVFFTACDSPLSLDEDSAARAVTAGNAKISAVTVTGIVGSSIATATFTLTLDTDYFDDPQPTTDVTSWFTNVPGSQLTATLTGISGDYDEIATIEISGTPGAISSAPITGTIPSTALGTGSSAPIIVNTSAVWDISWSIYNNWALSKTVIPNGSVNGLVYGNGILVASGFNDGTAAYSTDGGATWTPITDLGFGSNYASIIIYVGDNDTFYAAGQGGVITSATSANVGGVWTRLGTGLLGSGQDIRGIGYGVLSGGNYTIIVGTNGNAARTLGFPTPRSSWSTITPVDGFTAHYNSVAFGYDTNNSPLAVVTAQLGASAWSSDGTTWTDTSTLTQAIFGSTGSQSGIKMVAYSLEEKKFVAVGFHQTAWVVPTPATFTWSGVSVSNLLGTSAKTSWLNCVTYGNGFFVAGGGSAQSISSTDGINWNNTGARTQFPAPLDSDFINNIAYDSVHNVYVIGGGPDAGPGIVAY